MSTFADKSHDGKSQSIANTTSQKKNNTEPTIEFIDGRSEASLQRKIQMMANQSAQVSELSVFQEVANNGPKAERVAQMQQMADNSLQQQQATSYQTVTAVSQPGNDLIVQRAPARNQVTKNANNYTVEYTGTASDFDGGQGADAWGVQGVTGYQASVVVDKEEYDEDYDAYFPNPYHDNVDVDAAVPVYEYGHMLASELGGSGNLNNVFEQDGGQNRGGDWRSFEINARNAKNDAEDDDDMTYRITLQGNLNYHF